MTTKQSTRGSMTKYYLKEKCIMKHDTSYCLICKNKDFTRGADVTELIERMKSDDSNSHYGVTDYYIRNSLKDLIEVVER